MRTRRILLTLIAVFVVIVSGISLIRTVRSFYRLDFPVSWVEQGLVIDEVPEGSTAEALSLIHISEPTRLKTRSRMPSSA